MAFVVRMLFGSSLGMFDLFATFIWPSRCHLRLAALHLAERCPDATLRPPEGVEAVPSTQNGSVALPVVNGTTWFASLDQGEGRTFSFCLQLVDEYEGMGIEHLR